ncbi:MAG: DMT family transporter [Candidatus Nomurabacteria bacterium]|jgi:drug/metabolite transporter (DMT)-like permease|nr:DMT family transporter [Candidatus Nomurabacteria bacterium]
MKKTKKARYTLWLLVGLATYMAIAPSAMVTKIMANSGIDPYAFSIIRYTAMLACILLPAAYALFKHRKMVKRYLPALLIGSICLALSNIAYTVAIGMGQASHVSIINLLTPIFLVVLSAKLMHDRVSHRATVGIILAAIGGAMVVAVPMIASGSIDSAISPWSVALALVNCLLFPISMVYMRRANEKGVPLSVMLALSFFVNIVISLALEPVFYHTSIFELAPSISSLNWLVIILYCGVVVALLARILTVKTYEVVGAAVAGGLEYLHTLIAIVLPIMILNETLSMEIIGGAVLILLGIYLTESHHHLSSHAHLAHYHRKARH